MIYKYILYIGAGNSFAMTTGTANNTLSKGAFGSNNQQSFQPQQGSAPFNSGFQSAKNNNTNSFSNNSTSSFVNQNQSNNSQFSFGSNAAPKSTLGTPSAIPKSNPFGSNMTNSQFNSFSQGRSF